MGTGMGFRALRCLISPYLRDRIYAEATSL